MLQEIDEARAFLRQPSRNPYPAIRTWSKPSCVWGGAGLPAHSRCGTGSAQMFSTRTFSKLAAVTLVSALQGNPFNFGPTKNWGF
ncbi:unnamed protein product [Linum trigynum]|uniref:Uncharacterized protein n=1 Tax=Linum trigynum TaxID=586398 RepID=A0AAV2DGJ1_9ROSI